MGDERERWHLVQGKHSHVVEIAQGAVIREVWWRLDGTEVATKRTSDETIVLKAESSGAVRLKFPLVGPARRITLHDSDTQALTGTGGADFEPAPGSRAAARAEWIGLHPHLHTARQTAVAAAGVVLPIIVIWLLTKIPWPSLDIPWPDLPSIPWPDLPDLPGWVDTVRKFLIPVLIAFFIARGEVKRRRKAEEKEKEEKSVKDDSRS